MSEVENLILEQLRLICMGQDILREDMREVKTRLAILKNSARQSQDASTA